VTHNYAQAKPGASCAAGAASMGDGDPIVGASAGWMTGSEATTSTTIGSSTTSRPACPATRHTGVKWQFRGLALRGGSKHGRWCSSCQNNRERGDELHHHRIIRRVPTSMPYVQAQQQRQRVKLGAGRRRDGSDGRAPTLVRLSLPLPPPTSMGMTTD
jgi:hypothetical protein